MSALRRALSVAVPLSLAALAVAFHEDDPKMRDRVPAHMGRSVRSTARTGQPMASAGTARAFPASNVDRKSVV